MTIYVCLLPPSNRPILNDDDHFSFTYAFQLDHQSLFSPNPDRPIFVVDHLRPSPPASFPAGPRRLLESDGQITPSSPSWTAMATLLSHVKTSHNLSLHNDTIQWCPEFLAPVRAWTPLHSEEDLIRRVLEAARETVKRKKPSSLCVKIRKVVTLSSEKALKDMSAARKRIKAEDDVFESVVGLVNRKKFGEFEEVFSEDIEAARACWSGLWRRMGWDAVLDRERAGSVFGRVRVWELKRRVVNWAKVEPGSNEEEECCTICMEGGGGKYRLPCAHTYHLDCIFKWMTQKRNCPTCRFQL